MSYVTFDQSRPYDLVLLGRVAMDFNPVDYFQPLEQCTTFKKYVGGSPASGADGGCDSAIMKSAALTATLYASAFLEGFSSANLSIPQIKAAFIFEG